MKTPPIPLAPGTRLGPSEIVATLGAGGMGEVYQARDSRLVRDVAVKVRPQHLSDNPEVRARFERPHPGHSRMSRHSISGLAMRPTSAADPSGATSNPMTSPGVSDSLTACGASKRSSEADRRA